jgi:hypothetical protein
VQWFRTARLEWHPETHTPRFAILLGLLGRESLYVHGWPHATTREASTGRSCHQGAVAGCALGHGEGQGQLGGVVGAWPGPPKTVRTA